VARINLARRAEIGREKRARTRAQLIKAAKTLLTKRPIEAVTVDEVVTAAAVAKGTFYYHFKHLEELADEVASELAHGFDALIQSRLLVLSDPFERVAAALMAFLDNAVEDPDWGRLLLNGGGPPESGRSIRKNLVADLEAARQLGNMGLDDVELAADLVIGIWREVTRAIVEGRLAVRGVDVACAAMLRALGLTRSQASALTARVRGKAIDLRANQTAAEQSQFGLGQKRKGSSLSSKASIKL
jgi:AcrR family transcriptional regulator